jgi:DNA-binding CsgD family transcriptional regulator
VAESAGAVDGLVPLTVLHSLLGQLARLGPDAAAIATALAVLGDGSPLRRVAALAELPAERAEATADVLAEVGLLGAGEPLRFAHPLIATAVHSDAPAFARARQHREAASLLVAEGAPVREVASHLLLTRPVGDVEVLAPLREAAGAAIAQGDPAAGVRLLSRAVAEPPPAAQRGEILLALAEAEALAGDTAAAEHVGEALSLAEAPPDRARALQALSRIQLAAGDHALASRALEEVLEGLDPADPPSQAVLAEYLTANRFRAPLLPAAERHLEPIVRAARRGEPPREPALLVHAVLSLALAGEPPATVAALAERAARVEEGYDLASYGMLSGMLVQSLCCVDELGAAERVAARALASARRAGSFIATTVASFHSAIPRYHRGQLADALADLDQAQASRREGWEAATAWPLALQCHVQLERGEVAEAAETIAAAVAAPGSMDEPMVLSARARLALVNRDHLTALATATEAGRQLAEDFGIDHPGLVPWRRTAALAALALGETDRAGALAAAQLERGRETAVPRAISLSLRTVATVAGPRDGLPALEEAAELVAASPSQLERAHVLAELGGALRRAGGRADSREPLRRALELAARMGATPLAESTREELLAAGARPRRAALSGVDSLTPAERRVAQFAAAGLTNREIAQELFVTPKTVQTHLTSVYRKLEVDSREGLPAALAGAAA